VKRLSRTRRRGLRVARPSALAALVVALGCDTGLDTPDLADVDPTEQSPTSPRARPDGGGGAGQGGSGGSPAVTPDAGVDASAPDAAVPLPVELKVEFLDLTDAQIVDNKSNFSPEIKVTVSATDGVELPTLQSASLTVVRKSDQGLVGTSALDQSRPTVSVVGANAREWFFGERRFDLATQPSGELEITASAVTAANILQATATVTIRGDAGPSIAIPSPSEAQAKKRSVEVSVQVDDIFPIAETRAVIGNTPLTLIPDSGNPGDGTGSFTASIQFDEFAVPLRDGEHLITVRSRNANGSENVATRSFLVDNSGPAMSNPQPEGGAGAIFGGVIDVAVDIEDPAGVVASSVKAVFAHGDANFVVELTPPVPGSNSSTYHSSFDSTKLPRNAVRPNVSFRAADTLGNESTIGYPFQLDTMPPLSDLDPPRVVDLDTDGRCSWPFDPVGPDAVDDGQRVFQNFDIRARVEDQGNDVLAGGLDARPIVGVKSVDLLLLNDESRALVVDSDSDGTCDAINPLLEPTTQPMSSQDILLVSLVRLDPSGAADFTPMEPLVGGCQPGDQTTAPKDLCDPFVSTRVSWKGLQTVFGQHSHQMTRAMAYAGSANLGAIWTIGPPATDGPSCMGVQFDALGASVDDGWVCLAIRATDNFDAIQVSRPIRVCIDKDNSGDECPHGRISTVAADPVPGSDPATTTDFVVTTAAAHGLTTGDEVYIQEVPAITPANGRHTVTVLTATSFSLDGTAGTLAPSVVGQPGFTAATGGMFVPMDELPDCTGVQTAPQPVPAVDDAASCAPWRLFSDLEVAL